MAIAVSCSADRQALVKITPDGVFLEQLETDPARFLPEEVDADLDADTGGVSGTGQRAAVRIDLTQPMAQVLDELGRHPVKTRISLNGPLAVARDLAHAKLKERLDAGESMPNYLRDHPGYYAGPAKTPEVMPSGWPRTASPPSRCWSTRSSAWRQSGRFRSGTPRRSSSSTTRATTSSPTSPPPSRGRSPRDRA